MGKVNWNKIALQQYKAMPKSFQKDWADLRAMVYKHPTHS